jgi:hypothetical protein
MTFSVPVVLLLLALLAPARANAQAVWFPSSHPYESPLADPLEPRFAGSLLATDLLSREPRERPRYIRPPGPAASTEVQAAVTLGRTVPFVAWRMGEHGTIAVTGQASVNGRFRIELASRDDMGQDWMVAFPIEATWKRWSGRFRALHRSSHLGDEFAQTTGARRIEFGGDGVDLALAYQIAAPVRVYGSANWIPHSNTEQEPLLFGRDLRDDLVLQFGTDITPAAAPGRIGLVAAAHAEVAQRTNWRTSVSGIAGLTVRSERRSGRLVLRYHTGPSRMGEFFLTTERTFGLELVLDW